MEQLEYDESLLKSKVTGCGSILTVFSSICLLFVSSIIITIIIITIIIITIIIIIVTTIIIAAIYKILRFIINSSWKWRNAVWHV